MERCNRCGQVDDDLVALHRFCDEPGALTTELVCAGCLRRSEATLARRIADDPGLMAFVLELLSAIDRLELSSVERGRLVSRLERKVADEDD
jgi:hypothetical protein